ncbi:hypothetical protein D3C81_1851350 [compost metagenome]
MDHPSVCIVDITGRFLDTVHLGLGPAIHIKTETLDMSEGILLFQRIAAVIVFPLRIPAERSAFSGHKSGGTILKLCPVADRIRSLV